MEYNYIKCNDNSYVNIDEIAFIKYYNYCYNICLINDIKTCNEINTKHKICYGDYSFDKIKNLLDKK